MEEKRNFIVQDENGMQSIAEILTMLEIDGIEYVVYSIDNDIETSDVYAARVVKDHNGNDTIVSIENDEEKRLVFGIIEKMINES